MEASRLSRALVGLATTALFAAGLSATAPASAKAVDQVYKVPRHGRVTLSGRGFGHGHGMSQYGAQGAAVQGLGYAQILAFYYPGTELVERKTRVRVLLSSDPGTDVVVLPADGLRVRDLGSKTTYRLPDNPKITKWRLTVADGNKTVVSKYTNRWRRYRPAGEDGERRDTLVGDGQFKANQPLTLVTPGGERRYRGALRAASPSAGSADRDTVNVLRLDHYVRGVVPAEMPTSWEMEAVKAQAVAARTYATWSRNQNRTGYYQICDTTSCQVYAGLSAETARGNAAVKQTKGQILTWDGEAAFTQFSASTGGRNAKGSAPYLVSQPDPYDAWSGNLVHTWTATVDLDVFEAAYPSLGQIRRLRVVQRDGDGEWFGRVWKLVLEGSEGKTSLTGDEFRWEFGLRSNWFAVTATP